MYLLDTNIYISFYDRYYPKEVFPTFWKQFIPIFQQQVVVPDVVVAENQQSLWFRDEFLKQHYTKEFVKHRDYSDEWGKVLHYISESEYYSDAAMTSSRSWTNENIADGWLVAIAKKDNLTIVTNEARNINLNTRNKSKNPKVPDIADAFGVNCINMLEFFNEVKLKV